MDHPLRRLVRRIAQRARWLLIIRGMAWFATITLLMMLAAGGLDYLLRTREIGLRILISAGVAVIAVWSFCRYLWPVVRYRSDEVTTARWIERCRPEWRDELSSAIAFLRAPQDDPTAGSSQLRLAHVRDVAARLEQQPISGCLRLSYSMRPVIVSAIVSALVLAICWVAPASAQIAALRMVAPWNKLNWPRRNQLALINPPTRLAAGQDFEAVVFDRTGNLPEDVTIHYWFTDADEQGIEHVPMNYAGGRMFHRLVNVTRSFRYRVTGGDDDSMAWRNLEVVQPPDIEHVIVHIHPPGYTGWKSYDASGPLQALQGSRIEVELTLSEPVRTAGMRAEPPVIANSGSSTLPATLERDGRLVRSPLGEDAWVLGESGRYWFEITGVDGLNTATRAWDAQSISDEPPAVRLAPSITGAVIGTKANLAITVSAEDDIALKDIDVRVSAAGQNEPLQVVPLWSGPESIAVNSIKPQTAADTRSVSGTIDFGSLALQPGQSVELVATARDYKPQETRSASVQLRVMNDAELEDRLVQLQARLLATIDRALAQQREARSQTRSVEWQIEEQVELQPRHVDQLKGTDLHQRQVHQLLTSDTDSARAQADAILAELHVNQMQLPSVEQQVQSVIDHLQTWASSEIPTLERIILSTIKQATSDLEDGTTNVTPALQQAVVATASAQQDLLVKLEQLADELAEWEGFRRFAGQVRQLKREQQRIVEEEAVLRNETLGRDVGQLSAEHRAQLRRLSHHQMDLVRRYDDLVRRMMAAHQEAQSQTNDIAAPLATALEAAERQAIAAHMRDSAQAAQQNQLSEAATHQRQAIAGLDEMLAALTGRSISSPEALANQVQASREQVAQLQAEQDRLDEQRRRIGESSASSDEQRGQWVDQQQALAERAAELARQLQQARSAASTPLEHAAQAMSQTGEDVRQLNYSQAQNHAMMAGEALQEAAEMLAQQSATQQQQQWAQLKVELIQQLSAAIATESQIIVQVQEFEKLRQAQSLFSPEQQRLVHEVGGEQQTLAKTLQPLVERSATHPAIVYVLDQVTEQLSEAAARLFQAETAEATQQLQQQALLRMERLLEALQRESESDGGTTSGASDSAQPNSQQPSVGPQNFVSVEELELLQMLQQDLAERTAQLARRRDAEQGTETWQDEQRRLAAEQRRLSEILLHVFTGEANSVEDTSRDTQERHDDRGIDFDELDRSALPNAGEP